MPRYLRQSGKTRVLNYLTVQRKQTPLPCRITSSSPTSMIQNCEQITKLGRVKFCVQKLFDLQQISQSGDSGFINIPRHYSYKNKKDLLFYELTLSFQVKPFLLQWFMVITVKYFKMH